MRFAGRAARITYLEARASALEAALEERSRELRTLQQQLLPADLELLSRVAGGLPPRPAFRGRVLLVDNHVPLQYLGSGSPRAQEIIHLLCELGYFVTFFATSPQPRDLGEVDRELPEANLELVTTLGGSGFRRFWQLRRGHYDIVVISRPHNFRALLADGFDPDREPVRVIYDAEAVAAQRRLRQRELLGAEAPEEGGLALEEELALARRTPEIWAVSETEGKLLAAAGQRLSIISHAARGRPGTRPFDERCGILFVGRLVEAWNPNVDGLRWYLDEVHPRLLRLLGEEVPMTVAGVVGAGVDLPRPAGVRFLGRVADLEPLYDQHRIFVAPSRFAAGIPLKITEAASHGLPVAATSLLAGQLGWHDGVELVAGGDNDPERLADRVAELYTHSALWHNLRENAWRRIRGEHSREALKKALIRALDHAGD
ncbi:MAG: glycosyltransferase family 4 protein [bacterium]|nr:glycosyltransferase family 4 protein [bacterium]